MKTLKNKVEQDYEDYLKLCTKHNEAPRPINNDFYKHRNWLLDSKKINF